MLGIQGQFILNIHILVKRYLEWVILPGRSPKNFLIKLF